MPRFMSSAAAVLLLGGCGADVQSTLDAGQTTIGPVINALEQYRGRHQHYPDSLEVLTEEGMLKEIPVLPKAWGTLDVIQPRYEVSPDGSFYVLRFAYDFPGGIGPAAIITRYYTSDDRQWRTAKYPPSFNSLVADRLGRIYRDEGSYQALEVVVERLLADANHGAGCVNLFESFVTRRLGPGESAEIPADLRRERDTKVVRYTSKDPIRSSYIFVFQSKLLMDMNADRSFSDRNFRVARAVYEVVTGDDGSFDWRLLSECR